MELMKELLRSKKFMALVLGLTAILALKLGGSQETVETAQEIVVLLSAYMVGQGVADHGKEKAKIEGATASEARP